MIQRSLRVDEEGGGVVVNEGTFSVKITGKQADELKAYVGKEIYFGVRPEDLLFQESPAAENNMKVPQE